MAGTFLDGVALSALGLKDFLSGLDDAGRCLIEGRHWKVVCFSRKRETKKNEKVCVGE